MIPARTAGVVKTKLDIGGIDEWFEVSTAVADAMKEL